MAAFRDANLLIISLSTHAHWVHVGLGVSPETIDTPALSLPTLAYVAPELSKPGAPRQSSDYSFQANPDLVPVPLFSVEPHHGPQLTQSTPLVADWKALDTFFRDLIFTRLKLPKPPLAQHILLSVPPDLPNATRDQLTKLFFENLQASALFLADSPLLQVLACNYTSGITIDIGARSTLLGYVCDSLVQNQSCHLYPIGEQDCDDYLISLLLDDDPELPIQLGWSPTDPAESLYNTLTAFVSNLKTEGHIRFEPQLNNLASTITPASSEEEENGITDVAQAIVSGKVDKILGKQIAPNNSASAERRPLLAEVQKETDTIIIHNPNNPQSQQNPSSAPASPQLDCPASEATVPATTEPSSLPPDAGIRISKTRHRHAEPLFAPTRLGSIPPIFSKFGLEKYAARYTEEVFAEDDTLVQSINRGIAKLRTPEHRRDLTAQFVLTGAGGVMCRTEGLAMAISNELQLQNSTINAVNQSHGQLEPIFKPLRVPDYFSEFKGKPELLGFLGGCIVAKLIFNDTSSSKLWMSKVLGYGLVWGLAGWWEEPKVQTAEHWVLLIATTQVWLEQ